jgi:hypothetical protein
MKSMKPHQNLLVFLTCFLGHFLFAADAPLVLAPSNGAQFRIEFSRSRDVEAVKNGSIGEKVAEFEPEVQITNLSTRDYPGNRVCLIIMGEDATQDNVWKVIYRREFNADFKLSSTFEWKGDKFKQGFDRTLSKSGYDYDGYIVIIKNSKGEPVISGASKSSWNKDMAKAWALTEGQICTRADFK